MVETEELEDNGSNNLDVFENRKNQSQWGGNGLIRGEKVSYMWAGSLTTPIPCSVFLHQTYHHLLCYIFLLIYMAYFLCLPLECKFHENRDFCLFCLLFSLSAHNSACHTMCSIQVCRMNKKMKCRKGQMIQGPEGHGRVILDKGDQRCTQGGTLLR